MKQSACLQPTSASPTKFDGDRICERKSKGTFQRTSDLRPVMNTWMDGTTSFKPSASSRTTEHGPAGPSVADGTICRTGKARAWGNTLPSYDPIHHVVTAQSTSSTAQSLRQRENDRLWGTLGIKHRSPPQGSYDPIRCAPPSWMLYLLLCIVQGRKICACVCWTGPHPAEQHRPVEFCFPDRHMREVQAPLHG